VVHVPPSPKVSEALLVGSSSSTVVCCLEHSGAIVGWRRRQSPHRPIKPRRPLSVSRAHRRLERSLKLPVSFV
jgi:hypothetical protein